MTPFMCYFYDNKKRTNAIFTEAVCVSRRRGAVRDRPGPEVDGACSRVLRPTGWGRGWGGLRTRSPPSSIPPPPPSGEGGGGERAISGVNLTGRMFPGSSATGDLISLGVRGRPTGFCGGLCRERKHTAIQLLT